MVSRVPYATTLASLLTLLLLVPAAVGALWYEDVTEPAGIVFQTAGEVHPDDFNTQWPSFPEILSGGACWADFDGDGWQDLYLVNHRFNPDNPAAAGWESDTDPRDALYLNNGDGTFTDATDAAGIDGRDRGFSCAPGDADGDGDVDLYVGNYGRDRFLLNDGHARFTDRTDGSGIGAYASCDGHPCVSQSAAWADYDDDGDLDLYATNYVRTNYTDTLRGPVAHLGQVNRLYQNDGTGSFVDVAAAAGVAGNPTDEEGSKSFTAVWEDFDGDGDLDLYVTNDMVPNDYYENLGDGTFVERSNETGLADARASMGLTAGDFDGDCRPDLFFTHYQHQDNGLYRNRGDGTFEDLSGSGAHHNESWQRVGWGTHFRDVDLDGDEDILATNGHTEWKMDLEQEESSYSQQIELFRNDDGPDGRRAWVAIHNDSGPSFSQDWVGRGLSIADADLDGDADFVVVPNANQTASLHRASGALGNWLRVELRGAGDNTFGIGALVSVTVDGKTQCKRVHAGSGFLGQNELPLTFGLGAATHVDTLTVAWPGGGTTTHHDLAAGQALRLHESGQVQTDTLAPRTTLVSSVPGVPSAPGETWWTTPVTVSFQTVDHAVTTPSGVQTREVRLDDGPWTPYTAQSFHFAEEGRYTFQVRSTDVAGNREPERTVVVGRDDTPPTVAHETVGDLGLDGWYVSPSVQVTLQAHDAWSGIDVLRARVDGGDWRTYTAPIVFSGSGAVHTVAYEAVDRAGHVSTRGLVTVPHDPTPPLPAIVTPRSGSVHLGQEVLPFGVPGDDAWVVRVTCGDAPLGGGSLTVHVHTSDNGSGLALQRLELDGHVVASTTDADLTWPWPVDAGPLERRVLRATAWDRAGNDAEVAQGVRALAMDCPPDEASAGAGDRAAASPLVQVVPLVGVAGAVALRRRAR